MREKTIIQKIVATRPKPRSTAVVVTESRRWGPTIRRGFALYERIGTAAVNVQQWLLQRDIRGNQKHTILRHDAYPLLHSQTGPTLRAGSPTLLYTHAIGRMHPTDGLWPIRFLRGPSSRVHVVLATDNWFFAIPALDFDCVTQLIKKISNEKFLKKKKKKATRTLSLIVCFWTKIPIQTRVDKFIFNKCLREPSFVFSSLQKLHK